MTTVLKWQIHRWVTPTSNAYHCKPLHVSHLPATVDGALSATFPQINETQKEKFVKEFFNPHSERSVCYAPAQYAKTTTGTPLVWNSFHLNAYPFKIPQTSPSFLYSIPSICPIFRHCTCWQTVNSSYGWYHHQFLLLSMMLRIIFHSNQWFIPTNGMILIKIFYMTSHHTKVKWYQCDVKIDPPLAIVSAQRFYQMVVFMWPFVIYLNYNMCSGFFFIYCQFHRYGFV